jgi:Cu(I)/Ag(I) efflux system membrane protein CusA/SilA
MVGGHWLLGQDVSIATLIGFIALSSVASEFGVIMLLYLRQAWERRLAENPSAGITELDAAIREGTVLRARPKAMTVTVILVCLFPLFIGMAAGSEPMQRIGAPMIGGMVTALLLSILVIRVAYRLLEPRCLGRTSRSLNAIKSALK